MLKSMINPDLSGKKVILTLLIFLLSFNCLLAQFSGGSGTSGSPWQISNTTDLSTLSTNSGYWGDYFIQTANINAPAGSFSPIGNSTTYFTGSYDGDGHIIDGLSISSTGVSFIGLFGRTNNSNIFDLGVINVNISGHHNVGGLVGYNNWGTVSNCYSTGIVNGFGRVGGLVGRNDWGGKITECYSTSSASGVGYNIGGLVGFNNWGTVSNCYSTGSVNGGFGGVGGLVGRNDWGCKITECYSTGSVNGGIPGSSVGGLVGYNTGTVSNSFWDTETSGQSTSGGGTGKTTVEMKTQLTFTIAGWDFTNIWAMNAGINDGYSFLLNNSPYIPMTPPQLTNPLNNVLCQLLTPTLIWNTVEGADSYSVQVATDTDFTILVVDQSGIIGLQYTIAESILSSNTQYYWKANATNAGGTSDWSDIWNFTTFNLLSVDAGSDTTIYYGYGDENAILLAIPDGGNGQYSYLWSNNATTQTITVNPTTTTTYTVTVTDECNNTASDEVTVNVIDVRCGKKNNKVLVCHIPPGNPNNAHTICISPNAVPAHLAHGDYLGNCSDQLVTLPTEFELHTNYPNPFNPMTRIDYSLPFDSKVSLQIFDVLGREVVTLVDDNLKAGYYTIDFNASNLASGIYYYRMSAGDFTAIKKMVLLK